VDIQDVNEEANRRWERFKSPKSPKNVLQSLGLEELVRFQVANSVEFLAQDRTEYGMIFLDGNHDADIVYQEVPLACVDLRRRA
jgi:hypothetical protein